MKTRIKTYQVEQTSDKVSVKALVTERVIATAREVVNLTVVNQQIKSHIEADITSGVELGEVVGIVEKVYLDVTEAFAEGITMTIGDDEANARLLTADQLNLQNIGKYEISCYVKYISETRIKAYFNQSPSQGQIKVIITTI